MKKTLTNKGLNKIEIEVDFDKTEIRIGSNYSAWDSLFIALEGVAVLARMAIKEGVPSAKVGEKIKRQLSLALVGNTSVFEIEKTLNK